MLSQTSIPGPKFSDPLIKVKILKAIYVAGKECAVGSTAEMRKSEATFLITTRPPTVEYVG
jgi:hypothetical protein